jgi:NAD(P)H-dependent FMN reductase
MTPWLRSASTRKGRFSEKPAHWILQHLKKRDGVDARLLDLRDFPMPFFDQPDGVDADVVAPELQRRRPKACFASYNA